MIVTLIAGLDFNLQNVLRRPSASLGETAETDESRSEETRKPLMMDEASCSVFFPLVSRHMSLVTFHPRRRGEILDESGASVSNLLNQSVNALTDHIRSRLKLKNFC
jgi:hypothetical protein